MPLLSPVLNCQWPVAGFYVWGKVPGGNDVRFALELLARYNVHVLPHLAEDAMQFGQLDNFSAFPFENYLHRLKRLVKCGRQPLAQIVRRLHELHYTCNKVPSHYKSQKILSRRCPNNYCI